MTKAQKWQQLQQEETIKSAKYKTGDRVRYSETGEVYEITEVILGVFGGCEYRTKSTESNKIGIGFDSGNNALIKIGA